MPATISFQDGSSEVAISKEVEGELCCCHGFRNMLKIHSSLIIKAVFGTLIKFQAQFQPFARFESAIPFSEKQFLWIFG